MNKEFFIKIKGILKKYSLFIIIAVGLIPGHFINAGHIADLSLQIDRYQEVVNDAIDTAQSFVNHGNAHRATISS